MKRILPFIALITLFFGLQAQMPPRFIEAGLDLGLGASNNYFLLGDFFQETLVIDLDDIAANIGSGGYRLSANADARLLMNLKLKSKKRGDKIGLGLFSGLSQFALMSVPDSVFDLLSEGNLPDTTYSGDMGLRGDIFASIGLDASYARGPLSLSLSPSFYMPVVHIEKPTALYSLVTNSDGTASVMAQASIPLYSAVLLSQDMSMDAGQAIGAIFGSGGLDISLGGMYHLLPELSVGANFRNIPIAPARLTNRNMLNASFQLDMLGILSNVDTGNFYTMTNGYEFVSDQAPINVRRPFKMGAAAAYYPRALRWLTLDGKLELAIYDTVYADIGLRAKANLANIGLFVLSSAYEDMVWRNSANVGLNLRIVQMNLEIGSQSTDFFRALGWGGVYAGIGFRVGM